MRVSNSWQKAYEGLKHFIAENPSIEIGESVILIPGDVRSEFYRLFDRVRLVFVEEKFPPALLNEAGTLSESYTEVEQEVTKLLQLDSIFIPTAIRTFLHDPKEGLTRRLFDLLFDLLKGKVGIEPFEQRASEDIEATFRGLYQLGYEKWVTLSLIKLLEPDKNFRINLVIPSSRGKMKSAATEAIIPPPEESKLLSFEHQSSPPLIVPNVMVHSAKMNRYVAFGSAFVMPISVALNTSEKREWYPLDSIQTLVPYTNLIYVDDSPMDIALICDKNRICRPDLIIRLMEQKDGHKKEELEKVKLQYDYLKPKMGTYIVSSEAALEQEPEKPGEDIHILTVGFDSSKLASVISTLMSKESHSFVA